MLSFITHLDSQSALAKDISPEAAEWSSTAKTNAILADIFDELEVIRYTIQAVNLRKGKKPHKLTKYPRPGDKDKQRKEKIGSKPIPVSDIRNWVNSYGKNK